MRMYHFNVNPFEKELTLRRLFFSGKEEVTNELIRRKKN